MHKQNKLIILRNILPDMMRGYLERRILYSEFHKLLGTYTCGKSLDGSIKLYGGKWIYTVNAIIRQ